MGRRAAVREDVQRELLPAITRSRPQHAVLATVEFDAAAGETVRYRCENGLTGGGMVMVLMMGVAYLRVRLKRI